MIRYIVLLLLLCPLPASAQQIVVFTPHAAPAGGSLLLDTVSGGVAAYSLRHLRTAYAGDCIRVRRSSDNAEQDIGFAAGVLDESTLTTFTGAGDGFVVTWYDQSGNAYHATQSTTTLQPKIVSSGSVIVGVDGLPQIELDGTDDYMDSGTVTTQAQPFTIVAVSRFKATVTNQPIFGSTVESQSFIARTGDYQLNYGVNLRRGTPDTNKKLIIAQTNGATSAIRIDGAQSGTTGNAGTVSFSGGIRIGSVSNLAAFNNGYYQELILFDGLPTATDIESDINTFYTIY